MTPLQWDWVKPPALDTSLRDDVRNIRSNSILSWQAVEQTDNLRSRVMIYAGHINELNGAYQSFECTLADDGEFRVPENVRALYENGFSANFVDIVRYTRTRDLVEDISIVNVFVQKL